MKNCWQRRLLRPGIGAAAMTMALAATTAQAQTLLASVLPSTRSVSSGGAVSEFPVTTASSRPEGIVTGSDGALWFTEFNVNKIGRVTTSGAFTEYPIPTANSSPQGIAAGPDGAIWFTEFAANKIGRVALC